METEAALYGAAGRFLRAQLSASPRRGRSTGPDDWLLIRGHWAMRTGNYDMHQRYLGSWQEVVLVIKDDADGAVGVVLNRPAAIEGAASSMRRARFGALGVMEAPRSRQPRRGRLQEDDCRLRRQAAVAESGGQGQTSSHKAMVVHGLDDVEGGRNSRQPRNLLGRRGGGGES